MTRRRAGVDVLSAGGMLMMSLLCSWSAVLPSGVTVDNRNSPQGENIDTHVHLMTVRESSREEPGGRGAMKGPQWQPRQARPLPDRSGVSDYLAAGENLIKMMDQNGIKKVLLLPPPQILEQAGRVQNSAADNLAVVKAHPDRFALVAGGYELNPLIHSTKPSAVTESVRVAFQQAVERLVKEGVRGFGEMSVLHVAMQEKHNYSEAPADHPLFLELADLAARHNIPIDIHMEAVLTPMETPPFLAKISHNPKTLPATIPPFERLLQHNRGAKIVWQHIGWDNTGNLTPDLVRRLLRGHAILYAALRVEEANPRMRPFRPHTLTTDDGIVKPEWRALIADFPERFMIGSDEFAGIPGVTRTMPKSFTATWDILRQLPPDLARAVGHDNATRIYLLD